MTYQITYYCPSGQAMPLVEAFHAMLPADTPMEVLTADSQPVGGVQLVGFELKILDLHTLPLNIVAYLKKLEGKTVFLFLTVPFETDDVLERQIHKSVAEALPADCDYRGLYICPAQGPDILVDGFRGVVNRHPENTRAKLWLYRCEKAQGHPDQADIDKGVQFAHHVLKLNTTNP